MAQQTERTVAVGIFDNRQSAEEAVQRLRDSGFQDGEIGFLHHSEEAGRATDSAEVEPKMEEGAAAGAVAGGVAGGVIGALMAGLIPGIGLVLAGGILAGALGGATLGAAGGVVRALLDLGVPEEESRLYEQQFSVGRSILAVKAGERYGEAIGILRRAGASFARLEDSPEATEEYKPGNPAVVPESGAAAEESADTTTGVDVDLGDGTSGSPIDRERAA